LDRLKCDLIKTVTVTLVSIPGADLPKIVIIGYLSCSQVMQREGVIWLSRSKNVYSMEVRCTDIADSFQRWRGGEDLGYRRPT